MAKLKNIVQQLSKVDFDSIYNTFIESNADKSASLIMFLRTTQLSANKIMKELNLNTSAYYTLSSRLKQSIGEYLLKQLESPRTNLFKKVHNINEVLFTKKKTIAIATLKKLEKELLEYDLSNELTVVYKSLKKLHLNSSDYFNYSQLYNKHVAYMLTLDKCEDLLADYFKKYGEFILSYDDLIKHEMLILLREVNNQAALYDSHRLYVYKSCVNIFHLLFVNNSEKEPLEQGPIEDVFDKVDDIFLKFNQDTIYYHLNLVLEFLKLEYYYYHKIYDKAEEHFEIVNDAMDSLITNYTNFTFPTNFLITKIERSIRLNEEKLLFSENNLMFQNFEINELDVATFVNYYIYRAISFYYSKKYFDAINFLNYIITNVGIKKYVLKLLEIKTILALQYCVLDDIDLFESMIKSIRRHIRIVGKDKCLHVIHFIKILKIGIGKVKTNKIEKLESALKKDANKKIHKSSPLSLISLNQDFVDRILNNR